MFNKKVLLIHPSSKAVYDGFERKDINRIPIGLAYIAATAESNGYDTKVVDAEAENLSLQELGNSVNEFKPSIVGVTCTTPLFPITSKILDIVKEISNSTITVIGGPHINALPGESLTECSSADYVVFGEGEESFAELLYNIEKGKRNINIPGVGYRHGKDVILNGPRTVISDLDTIPFPARHKFHIEKYHDPDRYEMPYTLMVTSRGCPYRCIFCASSTTWGRSTRFRSVSNILCEIDEIVKILNINNITFTDDTFILKKSRVIDICKGIIERKYNLEFMCSSRINTTVDDETLEILAKAGCKEITFGVESGDESILKAVCKDIDLNKVKPLFEKVKSHGIRVHSSYIIGHPGDTHETIDKTINFAIDSGTDAAQFSISTPHPGTPLWQMALEQKKLKSRDYSKYKHYYSVVANLSNVSDEELISYQRDAYKRFDESRVLLG